jgi:hypothetical protein
MPRGQGRWEAHMKKLLGIVFVSALGLGAFAATAQAETLGITIPPSDSDPNACVPGDVIAQAASDPATPYFVPGPGTLTHWQTIQPDDASGEGVSLLVLKPVGDAFSVVAVDSRTIADPAPDLSSYTLATPIAVSGGETFGLYTTEADVLCDFSGGFTPLGNRLAGLDAPDPPEPGQTLDRVASDSPSRYALNVGITFEPTPTGPPSNPTPPAKQKKKCKKHKKHKRSAESAKKKCKKKKKR